MAKYSEPQETETATEGRNQHFEKFSVSINTKAEFYLLISLLNREIGHGREFWKFSGRPLRKIQRYSAFNKTVHSVKNSSNSYWRHLKPRSIALTLSVHSDCISALSKVFLQFERDK